MSRDSNGNYTLPEGPVITGTLIESDWANTTMDDLAAALTDSLSRTGQGGLQIGIEFPNGNADLPSITFINNISSGLYLAVGGDIRMSVNGTDVSRWIDGVFEVWDGAIWHSVLQIASDVPFTPTAEIVSTDVQAAIEEVNTNNEGTQADLAAHVADEANPHIVTQTQVGLSDVDNTSDADKPISTATQTALDGKEDSANVGATVTSSGSNANGYFRIWSDGYTEQWGRIDIISNGNTVVTLPVPFVTADSIAVTALTYSQGDSSGLSEGLALSQLPTTTQLTFSNNVYTAIHWRAVGY
jgi:hypothetical protein